MSLFRILELSSCTLSSFVQRVRGSRIYVSTGNWLMCICILGPLVGGGEEVAVACSTVIWCRCQESYTWADRKIYSRGGAKCRMKLHSLWNHRTFSNINQNLEVVRRLSVSYSTSSESCRSGYLKVEVKRRNELSKKEPKRA